MLKSKLLALCLVIGAGISCSSNSDSDKDSSSKDDDRKDDEDEPEADDPPEDEDEPEDEDGGANLSGGSTFEQVSSVAKMIYDAVEANEDVSPHIEAVLKAFGVPTLEPDDEEGAIERIDAGLPFVTTRVVEQMAAAYAQTLMVDVTGFGQGLMEQGVELAYPYSLDETAELEPLLGAMLYSYTILGESMPDVPLEPGYVLPSLVHELGQERARRTNPEEIEPAWGDGWLDPLQFTLLSFTILAKPASPDLGSFASVGASKSLLQNIGADAIKSKIKETLKDQAEDQLTSVLQGIVEVPLDKKDAAKVSVCGSLILYGHKVSIKNTPDLLWHAPKTPNLTTVEMTLTFEDDYHNNWARAWLGSIVTDLTGCQFPRQGPIEGKPVKWDVSSGLEGHGSYDLTGMVTNDDGKATATWRTVRDEFGPACQVFEKQRDAVGATEAVISGLLSGWSTVETIVTFLNPNTGTQGNSPLTVLYYEVTTDDPCHYE